MTSASKHVVGKPEAVKLLPGAERKATDRPSTTKLTG